MDPMNWQHAARAGLLAALLGTAVAGAQAQSLDALKGAASSALGGGSGSAGSSGMSGLAGMAGSMGGMGGLSAGTMGNAAGVLEYCFKNNYLSNDSVSAVKDGLLGKMGGSAAAQSDSSYIDGAKGLLKGSDGKSMDLSGGGMQKQLTQQACDFVLKQGKSLL